MRHTASEAKALKPVVNAVTQSMVSHADSLADKPRPDSPRSARRSGELATPIDYELLSLCSPERQLQFGNAILGRTVQAASPKGLLLTGRAEKAWMEDGQLHIEIGGETFRLSDLRALYNGEPAVNRTLPSTTPAVFTGGVQ